MLGKMPLDEMLSQVKAMAGSMKYQITTKEFIGLMGDHKDIAPYTVLTAKDVSATIVVNKGGRTLTNSLSLVDGKYMVETQSRGFVWKKAEEQPTATKK